MKRAIKEISAELFIKYLPLPEDLKIIDVVFNKESNTIKIYGYSEEYFDEPEGNHALNKLIIEDDFK